MIDPAPDHGSGELGDVLLGPVGDHAPRLLDERPTAPSGVRSCSERLPRDVLVRLAALSRQVGDLRQQHAEQMELSLRLDDVAAGLDAAIKSIYDETVQHFAGRRG